ncbi:hypothetical protein HK099_004625, partial [Clydaea vesicula]
MYEGYSSITAADLEQSTPWQYSDSKLDQCDNEIRVSFVRKALILTLGAFIGLSVFTVQSKWDFSGMAPFLCGALFALILTGFVQIFFPFNRIFDLVIAIITAL